MTNNLSTAAQIAYAFFKQSGYSGVIYIYIGYSIFVPPTSHVVCYSTWYVLPGFEFLSFFPLLFLPFFSGFVLFVRRQVV